MARFADTMGGVPADFLKLSRPLLPALLAAFVLTLLVNAPSLVTLVRSGRWDTALRMSTVGEDETRYLARIREAADGHPLMSNPMLFEHRNEPATNGYIEWVTAGWMRLTGMSLEKTLFITDLLFPFIVLFLTFLWMQALLSRPLVTLTALLLAWVGIWGMGEALVRDSSPKVTLILPSIYLCIVCLPRTQTALMRVLRGAFIGLMVYSYPYHWTVLLVLEGVILLHALLIVRRPMRSVVSDGMQVFLPFLLVISPYVWLTLRLAHLQPVAWHDTLMRFGLVETHGIAAPWLQLSLLPWILALWFARRTKLTTGHASLILLLLLIASIVTLNSNILTGQESDFEGHYGRFVWLFSYAAIAFLLVSLLPRRLAAIACSLIIVLTVALECKELPASFALAASARQEWDTTGEREVMDWLNQSAPAGSVVLAPKRIAMLISVHTSDYVLMNDAAHFFVATDSEMVDRYLIFAAFFPEEARASLQAGLDPVFGNYAGVAYARAKNWYRFTHLFRSPFPLSIADFVIHQDLRVKLERGAARPDFTAVRKSLQRYKLNYLITASPVPPAFAPLFTRVATVQRFTVYTFKS